MAPAPVIVCPLEFERHTVGAALRRAGLGHRVRLTCCGPGAAAVGRWAQGVDDHDGPVILAGLAGALRPGFPPRSAFVAGEVVGEAGGRWTPSVSPRGSALDRPAPRIVSVPRTLTTPKEKRAWAERCGADLVDRESAAFAEAATRRGWRWAVVRGVSDGPEAHLPAGVDDWVDEAGRVRPAAVGRALLRRPATIVHLLRLRADGAVALRAAADLLALLIGEGCDKADSCDG